MSGARDLIEEEQKLALLQYIRRRRKHPTAILKKNGFRGADLKTWEKGARMRVSTFYQLKEIFQVPDWSLRGEGDLSRATEILHRYLRADNSSARQVQVENYLSLIKEVLLRYLPNTDPQTDKILEGTKQPFAAVARFSFKNGRFASIGAQPTADSIYLTLWYHSDKYGKLEFVIAAFAGTCDLKHMIRLLRQIGRMKKNQSFLMDMLPREKFAEAHYHP